MNHPTFSIHRARIYIAEEAIEEAYRFAYHALKTCDHLHLAALCLNAFLGHVDPDHALTIAVQESENVALQNLVAYWFIRTKACMGIENYDAAIKFSEEVQFLARRLIRFHNALDIPTSAG